MEGKRNRKEDLRLIFRFKSITIPKDLTKEDQEKYLREMYKRKKELHEKLGALTFRKIVLKLEKLKFKGMKKIIPNFMTYYEKICDFNTKRKVRKAKSSEEVEGIEYHNKIAKLKTKKEWNKEENRNYHIDARHPVQLINYLKWNKRVHQKGLKKDFLFLSLFTLGSCYSLPFMVPLLVVAGVSTLIDLECINLQEHSIAEYEICKPLLIKKEKRDSLKRSQEYQEAKKIVGEATLENRKILTVEEVVGSIKTKEQAVQLREWAISMQKRNQAQKDQNKILVK